MRGLFSFYFRTLFFYINLEQSKLDLIYEFFKLIELNSLLSRFIDLI